MKTWEQQFKEAVQALAQPAEVQRDLFPKFVCVGDELAMTFDEALTAFLAEAPELTTAQRQSIETLDSYLEELSGEQNSEFWLNVEQLSLDPRWDSIREKATSVLNEFSWPKETPSRDGATYVSKHEVVRNR